MWRRNEQSCDDTHLVIQGVLVRFLRRGQLMAPRRSILFLIRFLVTVFKTARPLLHLSIPDITAWFLEFNFYIFSRLGLDSEAVRYV